MPQRFQVVTLRVPFNPPAQQAPSTWAWENLPIHATLLDADPVSEDPDVQPIERLPNVDDVWGEHPLYSRSSWRHEVSNGDTNQGYWEWCELQSQDEDHPANQPQED